MKIFYKTNLTQWWYQIPYALTMILDGLVSLLTLGFFGSSFATLVMFWGTKVTWSWYTRFK